MLETLSQIRFLITTKLFSITLSFITFTAFGRHHKDLPETKRIKLLCHGGRGKGKCRHGLGITKSTQQYLNE